MKIEILNFGIAKDIFGAKKLGLELDAGQTVAGLRQMLEQQYPALKKLSSYMIAVNDDYVPVDQVLTENDEIAVIPPVSGG